MAPLPLKKAETYLERRSGNFFSPFQREMNRLVEDFFMNFPSMTSDVGFPTLSTPAINVSEKEKSYTITAELPGVREKDIEISITKNSIQIKGEKEVSNEEKENGFISMERSYGSFYRSIPFSTPIDENKVKAVLKDGVLTIDIPKSSEAVKGIKKISIHKG